ncbi:MAG: alpha/beta hydrolase [Flaviramulus sp.]|nr:alpha/beta hydrolase [Flaviramulus sp.]
MKQSLILLISILSVYLLPAQDVTGQWHGVLKVQGIQLRLDFDVNKTEDGFTSTMDSPDQGATGIPVAKTTFKDSIITFEIPSLTIIYVGELKGKLVIGTFKQAGQEFPMDLSRNTIEKQLINKPQEPKPPYPYNIEEVCFENTEANIILSGTLTIPKNTTDSPVVILISGSGPQNRDEELFGHKPFLVIADYLTKNGIAVLRYDDRGVAKSSGDFNSATTADLATDVESAIEYLKTRKDINKNNIGLIGHSEGGMIAPMIASKSKDVSFIVLLAGPGISGYDIVMLQTELINKANGAHASDLQKELDFLKRSLDIVVKDGSKEEIESELSDFIEKQMNDNPETLAKQMKAKDFDVFIKTFTSSWMRYFLKFNPKSILENVKCPVFAINGKKDLQVPSNENLTAIKSALTDGGNKNVTIKEYPNLNHLFQESETGSPTEYGKIEQTFSPVVLVDIMNWIVNQMN